MTDARTRGRLGGAGPEPEGRVLLLTGTPGVGKTTALRRALEGLEGRRIAGFLTDEQRERGARTGFVLATLDGQRAVLAHVASSSPHRVGRYGVELAALERVVGGALVPGAADLHVIDEIGRMECLSTAFVAAVTRLLDGTGLLVATVALRGGGFIAEVKRRPHVECWEITRANRDAMPARIRAWIDARLPGGSSTDR